MSTNILGIGPTLWLSRHLHMPRTTGPGQILYNTIRKSQDKFSEKKFFFSKMSAGSIHLSMQVGLNLDVDIAYTCFMGSWLKIRICRIARTYSLRSFKTPSTSKSCTKWHASRPFEVPWEDQIVVSCRDRSEGGDWPCHHPSQSLLQR